MKKIIFLTIDGVNLICTEQQHYDINKIKTVTCRFGVVIFYFVFTWSRRQEIHGDA